MNFFAFFDLIPEQVFEGIVIIFALVFIVAELRAKRRAGALLLDLRRVRKVWMGFWIGLGSLLVLAGMSMLILGLSDGFSDPFEEWMDIVMMLSLGVYMSLGVFRKGVTEHGLLMLAPFRFVTWELIESYEWGGKSGHTLIVRLRRRRSGKVKLSVPPVHKEAVEGLLVQYLPAESGTGDERRIPDE